MTPMIFGVHNYYNNNADRVGCFSHPAGIPLFGESSVRLTDQGLVIFNLSKKWLLDEKLAFAETLETVLQEDFGQGFVFATCGLSDCTHQEELNPFYQFMKRVINPDITTIYATRRSFRDKDKWIGCPADLEVDHIVDSSEWDTVHQQVVSAIKPTEEDMIEPPEGWRAYEEKLRNAYDRALGAKVEAEVRIRTAMIPPPKTRRAP